MELKKDTLYMGSTLGGAESQNTGLKNMSNNSCPFIKVYNKVQSNATDYASLEQAEQPSQNDLEVIHFDPGTRPNLGREIIEGILHEGCVAILSAPSKVGKTFCSAELVVAVATGAEWLGRQCAKGDVLVLDGEMRPAALQDRYEKITWHLGLKTSDVYPHIHIVPLRGKAQNLKGLESKIIDNANINDCSLIIVDPAYPFMTGDENSAGDVREFTNSVLKIAEETGCAVLYTHHYSKGSKGNTDTIDRMSGSGMFARTPDAIIDMIELVPTEEQRAEITSDDPAFRVSTTLREFPSLEPFNCWFHYPVHVVDTEHVLDEWEPMRNARMGGNTTGEKSHAKKEKRVAEFEDLVEEMIDENNGNPVKTKDVHERSGISSRTTVNSYLDESKKYERRSTDHASYVVPKDYEATTSPSQQMCT